VTKWANNLAEEALRHQFAERNWDELVGELTEGVDELQSAFKKARTRRTLCTNFGEHNVEVIDDRNRVLSYAILDGVIAMSCSWRPSRKYAFTSPSESVLSPLPGESFPGFAPNSQVLITTVIEASVKELLKI
jgi:hypothetical protein